MIRNGRLLVGGLLVLALAGCGSDPTSTTGPISGFSITPSATLAGTPPATPEDQLDNTDCRSLATAGEVSEILGTKITGPKPAPSASFPARGVHAAACNYTGDAGFVLFILATLPDAGTARLIFDRLRQAQGGEDVPGLGDQAFFAPNLDTLAALQGNTYLTVSLAVSSLGSESARRTAAVKLGTQVLSRFADS